MPTPPPGTRDSYYISPSGSDANDGRSQASPFRTFARAFSVMPGGGTLYLLDGVYSSSAGTGTIHYSGTGSGQPRSGTASQPTQVLALNPGRVSVEGKLFIGRSTRKDSYIRIAGITFQGGGHLYNTSYVAVKDCGFHGPFTIGTNDHQMGNTRNLVEDVWIWASGERIIARNYRADENVWRRVVVRGDGCGTAACQGSGNPNVGITVYDSHDASLQNVIVVDRILLATDAPYADFATAQHTAGAYLLGRNEWLGTISLKSPDIGYYFEADHMIAGPTTHTITNAVAWDSAIVGFNIGDGSVALTNLTAHANGHDGVRVAPEVTGGMVTNIEVARAGRYGINSVVRPTYCNVFGATVAAYNQTTCTTGATSINALADGSLKHITRIEPGSSLSRTGAGGADKGANVEYRYGRSGSRWGESGYNAPTAELLWPWPNETRIKREMCDQSGITRGFCSATSLTDYVWGYLGNR